MKKVFCVFICLFILLSNPIYYSQSIVLAETDSAIEVEQELEEEIDKQLSNLDTSKLDKAFADILGDSELFVGDNFTSNLKGIISGDIDINAGSFLSYIGNMFLGEALAFLPCVCLIVAVAVLYGMVSGVHEYKGKDISNIIHFACFGVIVVIVLANLTNIIGNISATLGSIKNQMDIIFPLLLTMLTALGSLSSVNIYQPAMAVLSGSIISIFVNILLPIFTFKLVFTIIANLSSGIKFSKFSDFFGALYKWIIGIVLTIFSAFVSIQGLMAGSIDGVSIRTAKYTIKSGIPIIGGFLSDGVSLIMLSSSLIKNALGMGGLLLMFSTILLPVIQIIAFSLLLKLASAILEPIADSKITGFISEISKSIALIVAIILGVAFMYFILVGLVMCSVNIS